MFQKFGLSLHEFCIDNVMFERALSFCHGILCAAACAFDSQGGTTALIHAAVNGRAECVRLLIDAGADKEAKNDVRRRSLLC